MAVKVSCWDCQYTVQSDCVCHWACQSTLLNSLHDPTIPLIPSPDCLTSLGILWTSTKLAILAANWNLLQEDVHLLMAAIVRLTDLASFPPIFNESYSFCCMRTFPMFYCLKVLPGFCCLKVYTSFCMKIHPGVCCLKVHPGVCCLKVHPGFCCLKVHPRFCCMKVRLSSHLE